MEISGERFVLCLFVLWSQNQRASACFKSSPRTEAREKGTESTDDNDIGDDDLTSNPFGLQCNTNKVKKYAYESVSKLWGDDIDGLIKVNAEVLVTCIKKTVENNTLHYMMRLRHIQIETGGGSQKEPFKDVVKVTQMSAKPLSSLEYNIIHFAHPFDVNFSLPFLVHQRTTGGVESVLFLPDDTDAHVRNVKRHVAEAFGSHLQISDQQKAAQIYGENETETETVHNKTVHENSMMGLRAANYQLHPKPDGSLVVKKNYTHEHILCHYLKRMKRELTDLPVESFDFNNDIHMEGDGHQVFKEGHMISSVQQMKLKMFPPSEPPGRKARESEGGDSNAATKSLDFHVTFSLKLQNKNRRTASTDELVFNLPDDSTMDSFRTSSMDAEPSQSFSDRRILSKLKAQVLKRNNLTAILKELVHKTADKSMMHITSQIKIILKLENTTKSWNNSDSFTRILKEKTAEIIANLTMNKCLSYPNCLLALDLLFKATKYINRTSALCALVVEAGNLTQISHSKMAAFQHLLSNSLVFSDKCVKMYINGLKKDPTAFALQTLSRIASTLESNKEMQEDVAELVVKNSGINNSDCGASYEQLKATSYLLHTDYIQQHIFKDLGVNCALNYTLQSRLLKVVSDNLHFKATQNYMQKIMDINSQIVSEDACKITKAIISTLNDKQKELELSEQSEWPLVGITEFDTSLVDLVRMTEDLSSSPNTTGCALNQIIKYLKNRIQTSFIDPAILKEILPDLDNNLLFISLRQSLNASANKPQVASFVSQTANQILSDGTLTQCSHYVPIAYHDLVDDEEGFQQDLDAFDNRKMCVSHKKIGVRKANVEFYAGLFAGEIPDNSSTHRRGRYKMVTDLLAKGNFWGHEYKAAGVKFSYSKNSLEEPQAHFKVKIGREPFFEFILPDCRDHNQTYNTGYVVPLVTFSVWLIQVELAAQIIPSVVVQVKCNNKTGNMEIKPEVDVKIQGEAGAMILGVEGGLTVDADFNYHVGSELLPSDGFCFKGHHGNEDMSLSIGAFHRIRQIKMKCCFRFDWYWGSEKAWSPSMLRWNFKKLKNKTWIDKQCLLPRNNSSKIN